VGELACDVERFVASFSANVKGRGPIGYRPRAVAAGRRLRVAPATVDHRDRVRADIGDVDRDVPCVDGEELRPHAERDGHRLTLQPEALPARQRRPFTIASVPNAFTT
jgi:hypothetical protein